MEIVLSTKPGVKCDVKGCNNMTANYILVRGRVGKMHICDECLSQLVQFCLPRFTPKSPKNTIKKIIDSKKMSEGDVIIAIIDCLNCFFTCCKNNMRAETLL